MHSISKWVALLFALILMFPFSSRADQPDCVYDWIAPGQRTVTPAQVSGSAGQHLELHVQHPQYKYAKPEAADHLSYLVAGDKVDLVTTCMDYTYVRFHGSSRVSTGWVSKDRIKVIGQPFVPLPANATALCRAAQEALNSNYATGQLNFFPSQSVDAETQARLHLDEAYRPQRLSRFTVGHRQLVAIQVESGGTCTSREIQIWKSDLSSSLVPHDISDRDPGNDGSNAPFFGVDYDLVEVQGEPMVRASARDGTHFLSVIDKDGDIVPTCEVATEAMAQRNISMEANAGICHAFKANLEKLIPTHDPHQDESIAPLNDKDKRLLLLNSEDNGAGGGTRYTLRQTALADLDNSGHARPIGIVHYEYTSGAGCGSGNTQDVPVFLDAHGKVDLHSSTTKTMFNELTTHIETAHLAQSGGVTYIELSSEKDGPAEQVWKMDTAGAHKVCQFQMTHFVVKPITKSATTP